MSRASVLPLRVSGGGGGRRRMRMKRYMLYVGTCFLAWTVLAPLTSVWEPRLPRSWPTNYFDHRGHPNATNSIIEQARSPPSPPAIVPQRVYKSNGYLMASSNGGLNQMRAGICDMVTVARYLNFTLVVPELDKNSFWSDPSDFKDIFNVNHFINSLRDEVKIIKKLPAKFGRKTPNKSVKEDDQKKKSAKGDKKKSVKEVPRGILYMHPVSWSSEKYYLNQILPLAKKHKVIHFNKTDSRLANNGLPVELQKLRCRVNYEALKFTPEIEALGDKLISILRRKGSFLVLHLRYEMDMLSFSGCTHGCSDEESQALTKMRYEYPWWKEKVIVSEKKRLEGLCPLTPEEISLVLQALGFTRDTQIYIASGEIYGGERRLAALKAAYPEIVRKEMLLSPDELRPFQNHSTQMAALDYLVSVASDVFIPSYDGNMAKVVEGHRRFAGFRQTILLDRKKLVNLLDLHQDGKLSWDQFSNAVREAHESRMGQPRARKVIPGRPKEEDNFYANPQECLPPLTSPGTLISEADEADE